MKLCAPATASCAPTGNTRPNCRRAFAIIALSSTLTVGPTARIIAASIINFTIARKFRSAAVILAAAIAIGAALCAAIRNNKNNSLNKTDPCIHGMRTNGVLAVVTIISVTTCGVARPRSGTTQQCHADGLAWDSIIIITIVILLTDMIGAPIRIGTGTILLDGTRVLVNPARKSWAAERKRRSSSAGGSRPTKRANMSGMSTTRMAKCSATKRLQLGW